MKAFKDPLTNEEEMLWLERFENGEQLARDILIERNLRLVAHIIKKYNKGETISEDLISIGTIGLIKAVNSYKRDKGIKLGTYASKCIENEILMHLRSEKKKNREISLYEPVGVDKEGNSISLLEIIECEDKDVAYACDLQQSIYWLASNFKKVLNEREQEILIKRYGLQNQKEMTQRELADKLKISRSYVSRIEKRAINKLRNAWTDKGKK